MTVLLLPAPLLECVSGEDEGDLGLVVPFFLMSALLEALPSSVVLSFFGVVVLEGLSSLAVGVVVLEGLSSLAVDFEG